MKETSDAYVALNGSRQPSKRRWKFCVLILGLLLVTAGIILVVVFLRKKAKSNSPAIALLSNGAKLEGHTVAGVDQWLGIRYAAAPEGERRWAPPQAFNVPSGVYASYGASCLQPSSTMNMSEDCLFLNVFRPAGTSADAALPVFFWIHGGGYLTGHAQTYPGEHLAKFATANGPGVILVTINYRVGILGFLSLPGQAEVNYGLRDQVAALLWTKQNIAAFGGDPTKITIGGESAGGGSVCWHYANPELAFVHGVIAESPAPWMGTFYRQTSDQRGKELASRFFNCSIEDVLECMRNVSATTLLQVVSQFWTTRSEFDPRVVVDYEIVQGDATDVFKTHPHLPNIPILIGSNNYEGNLFAFFNAQYNTSETEKQFEGAFSRRYGDLAANVTSWVEDTINASGYFAADSRVEGQEIVSCGCQMVTDAAPVAYSYVFGAQTEDSATLPFLGSTHSTEMHFVFGAILLESAQLPLKGLALQFARESVMPLWMKFIYGEGPWQKYNKSASSIMYFSENYTTHMGPPDSVLQHKWDLCPQIVDTLYPAL